MAKDLYGVFAVLVTPFTEDDKIDEVALRKHVRYLIDEGKVHGLLPTGSTGEFTAMTEPELQQVGKIVIDEAAGAVPVVLGTAAVSTKQTIERSQFAQEAGADGVMIIPSYYCHPNDAEIYNHFKNITENLDIPIIAYNNPGTSGVDMLPPLIADLAELKGIDYIKESSGDMTRIAQIRRLTDDKLTIFCGCDNLSMEMFMMGAKGWIVPGGNIIPQLCVELFTLTAEKKDYAAATALYNKLLPFFTMFEESGQYIQLSKAGLNLLGKPYGKPRLPLLPPTDADIQKLKEILDGLV
jgi:4-hydroxy-tetrahydrodipicolinate synthase